MPQRRQVRLWCGGWQVSRVYDHSTGNRGEPQPNKCHRAARVTEQSKGSVEIDRDVGCFELICVKVNRQVSPLLSDVEKMEGILVDQGV